MKVMTAVAASDLIQLARERGWELLVLFGSRARGTANPSSDTDIGVMCGTGPRESRGLEAVDLIWRDDASWLLCSEVAREGRCLWERQVGSFAQFQGESLRRSWNVDVWRWRLAESLSDWTPLA
jgi:predicted nucleotidyltransferase